MLFKEDQGIADRLRRAPILALWRRELFDVARADAVELRVAEERKQVDAQHALVALQRRRFPPHALQELEEAFAGLREGHALGGSRTRSARGSGVRVSSHLVPQNFACVRSPRGFASALIGNLAWGRSCFSAEAQTGRLRR